MHEYHFYRGAYIAYKKIQRETKLTAPYRQQGWICFSKSMPSSRFGVKLVYSCIFTRPKTPHQDQGSRTHNTVFTKWVWSRREVTADRSKRLFSHHRSFSFQGIFRVILYFISNVFTEKTHYAIAFRCLSYCWGKKSKIGNATAELETSTLKLSLKFRAFSDLVRVSLDSSRWKGDPQGLHLDKAWKCAELKWNLSEANAVICYSFTVLSNECWKRRLFPNTKQDKAARGMGREAEGWHPGDYAVSEGSNVDMPISPNNQRTEEPAADVQRWHKRNPRKQKLPRRRQISRKVVATVQ